VTVAATRCGSCGEENPPRARYTRWWRATRSIPSYGRGIPVGYANVPARRELEALAKSRYIIVESVASASID